MQWEGPKLEFFFKKKDIYFKRIEKQEELANRLVQQTKKKKKKWSKERIKNDISAILFGKTCLLVSLIFIFNVHESFIRTSKC